jgi:excinuclease ABC subunit C
LRDRLKAMSHIQSSQGVNPATVEEADLFALHSEGGQACVQVFFFRAGQNWGNRPTFRATIPTCRWAKSWKVLSASFTMSARRRP